MVVRPWTSPYPDRLYAKPLNRCGENVPCLFHICSRSSFVQAGYSRSFRLTLIIFLLQVSRNLAVAKS
jgi:hypothetical protein